MTKWMYAVRFVSPGDTVSDVEVSMNAMGWEEREIAGFFSDGSATAITYKRPIENVRLISITEVEEEDDLT